MDLAVKSALKFLQLAVATLMVASTSPARAVTDIMCSRGQPAIVQVCPVFELLRQFERANP